MQKQNYCLLLSIASKDLVARLEQTLPDADDEKAVEAFADAEHVIDGYLRAVAAQSTQLPSGPELALACAHVLVVTMTLTEDDLATLAQFNAPTLGVSLYKVAPLVEDMKQCCAQSKNEPRSAK